MLQAGQQFHMTGSDDLWQVLHVNESRAHCISRRQETTTIGDRTFQATSRRTIDISPNSAVDIVGTVDVVVPFVSRTRTTQQPRAATKNAPRTQTAQRAPIVAATSGYRLRCVNSAAWLRRMQPSKPGATASYKIVTDVTQATVIKTLRQAEAKLAEVVSLHNDDAHAAKLEVV